MRDFMESKNPFFRFMTRLFDLAFLNLLWLVAGIPIISLGASTASMYSVALKIANNEDVSVWKAFWIIWRANWRQAIPLGLIFFAIAALFTFDIWYFIMIKSAVVGLVRYIICLIFVVALAVTSVTATYSLILLPIFDNTITETLRNGLYMALYYPFRSLGVLAVNASLIAALFGAVIISPASLFVLLFFGGSLAALINCLILRPVLKEYMPEGKEK